MTEAVIVKKDAPKKGAKTDRRIVRTRKAISAALDKLLAETDVTKITVSAIAREADIDRKTFYLHYSSIDNLLMSRGEESIEEVIGIIRRHRDGGRRERIHAILQDVNTQVTNNVGYYKHIAKVMSTDSLLEMLASCLHPALEHSGIDIQMANVEEFRMRARFYLAGALSLYRTWILSDLSTPIESVSATLEEAFDTDAFPVLNITEA